MPTAIILLTVGLIGCIAYAAIRSVAVYGKYRGDRVVACPETQRPADVRVDLIAAVGTAWSGSPQIRLNTCSRWPERQNCGQACLAQIEEAPGDCLVRVMLVKWYADKVCVCCGKLIGEIRWTDHRPALLSPTGELVEWPEVLPEALPGALATHQPICWNCLVVQRMVGEHPELIVDRYRQA
jgi:hypothetical protein